MKKFVLLALLCIGSVFACRCAAAEASADEISVSLLKEWAAEQYGCKIDEDGDLKLNGRNGKFFVSVIPKAKLIRVFSLWSKPEERSVAEMKTLANKFNDERRLLRVSIDSDGDASCDYYIVYTGGLNSVNFLEALDWFTSLEETWVDAM